MSSPSSNGLRDKPRNLPRIIATIAAVAWAAMIFGLSSIPGSGFPSHPEILNVIAHFCLYLIFGVLLTVVFHSPKRALWKSALIALVIASLYGASDEFHQQFTGRNCDVFDWLTDTIGALIGVIATIWFISARKVKRSRDKDSKLGL